MNLLDIARAALAADPAGNLPSLAVRDEAALLAWLDAIGETDAAIRSYLIHQCRRDPAALAFFLALAAELSKAPAGPLPVRDDRRPCTSCSCLTRAGDCLAAPRGELPHIGRRKYSPSPDLPRRCEGYRPRPGDPDQRTGAERWLGLADAGRS